MPYCCEDIIKDIRKCNICEKNLPLKPRPIIQVSANARVVIVGQAPGIKAHNSNKPWNDASGERLRSWLGLETSTFYDESKIALVPIGFCYPGKGPSGDLPPRSECAPKWHAQLMATMPIKVTILIGQHAQNYYLKDKRMLTQRVKYWNNYQPNYFVLPHPSPRNNIWLKKNPWFESDVIPIIRARVRSLLFVFPQKS
ncbi:MAG: uracil-DNA glycosylase [Congregibacter sp.]|jgi:uracil-DNA glycosylase